MELSNLEPGVFMDAALDMAAECGLDVQEFWRRYNARLRDNQRDDPLPDGEVPPYYKVWGRGPGVRKEVWMCVIWRWQGIEARTAQEEVWAGVKMCGSLLGCWRR